MHSEYQAALAELVEGKLQVIIVSGPPGVGMVTMAREVTGAAGVSHAWFRGGIILRHELEGDGIDRLMLGFRAAHERGEVIIISDADILLEETGVLGCEVLSRMLTENMRFICTQHSTTVKIISGGRAIKRITLEVPTSA